MTSTNSDEPMTDAQRISLDILAGQTGEPTPASDLTQAEAEKEITHLRHEAGLDETDASVDASMGGIGKISADDDYDNRPDMTTDSDL